MVSIGALLAVWGFWWEPDRLEVRRVTLALPGWPLGHEPLTVAVMSDLHAGSPHIDAAKIVRIVESINAARPDLVLLLGDYVIHGVVGGTRMDPVEIGGFAYHPAGPVKTWRPAPTLTSGSGCGQKFGRRHDLAPRGLKARYHDRR